MVPARSVARLLRAGLLIGVVACVGHAGAQDKPRPRPKPLPEPSDTPTAVPNSLSDQNSVGAPDATRRTPATSATGTPLARPLISAPPPLVLRSAVHSRYSRQAVISRSTTGQCRAQCAVARNQCSTGQGDTSGCDPGWTQCLSTCGGLNYARGP